jgi:hypothetical protein
MRTLKEELVGLREWPRHHQLEPALADGVTHYNAGYHHSALGCTTPSQVEADYQRGHLTQFTAA